MTVVLILCSQCKSQTKADKIKLALEKLKEAKVRKVKSDAVFFFLVSVFTMQLHNHINAPAASTS